MSAAFRGEYDALQKYVPMINAANVEQRALADTGKASAAELTALDKATAAYELTIEGAGAATGDFARTSDGWANTMKTLNAYWGEFKTLIGETLLPILTPLLDKIKELAIQYLPMLSDYIHEHVIPAIEEWAANFDDWWADHGQPFIDDVKQAWEDIQTEAAASMGVTRDEFKLNLEGLEAVAGVLGKRIGTALGESIGQSVQEWWDNAFAVWWQDKIDRITSGNYFLGPGGLGDLNSLLGPQPPVAPIGPSLGPNQNGAGTSSGSGVNPYAVTINNYVDATSRSVGEAARDGTLDGLRQAGMR
jgi:hypothetical protein